MQFTFFKITYTLVYLKISFPLRPIWEKNFHQAVSSKQRDFRNFQKQASHILIIVYVILSRHCLF